MGYNTDFIGRVEVDPPLNEQEIEYLRKFSESRRMDREKGPYFVDGENYTGLDKDSDIINHNRPPEGQPGLWCDWVPNDDGTAIEWNGDEKSYDMLDWMEYLIVHFIGSLPNAKVKHPEEFAFLQSHTCNGFVEAQGEDPDDRWAISVEDNIVTGKSGRVVYE